MTDKKIAASTDHGASLRAATACGVRIIKSDAYSNDSTKEWAEVQAAQHEPFIYIKSNGGHVYGVVEDDVSDLLQVLAQHTLDPRFERIKDKGEPTFYTVDPCKGVRSDDGRDWVDGPRLYERLGVVNFFGNFFGVSHVFNIDTNHQPTIDALMAAIAANEATDAYKAARAKRAA